MSGAASEPGLRLNNSLIRATGQRKLRGDLV